MPFISLNTSIPNILLGVWEVVEDEMFFLTRLKMYENEWCRLEKIAHPRRRLEWLSSRLCMKEMLKISHRDRVESLNQLNGKPYLSNRSHSISYTHSNKYSAAIASTASEVGIDIEYLKRKRNLETRFIFMNAQELDVYHANPSFELFILIWSAKETLYKIISQEGLGFRRHIFLDLNYFTLKPNGMIRATVKRDDMYKEYEVHYVIQPEFVLTYTVDCLSAVPA